MGTIFALPAAWAASGVILGFIIAGALFVLGVFSKEKKANTKDGEDALNFVNSALEKKIKLLQDQIQAQSTRIGEQEKRIAAIELENKLLKEVLQGRDDEAQAFQQMGFETMQTTIPEILRVTQVTSENVNKLCQSIDDLVQALKK